MEAKNYLIPDRAVRTLHNKRTRIVKSRFKDIEVGTELTKGEAMTVYYYLRTLPINMPMLQDCITDSELLSPGTIVTVSTENPNHVMIPTSRTSINVMCALAPAAKGSKTKICIDGVFPVLCRTSSTTIDPSMVIDLGASEAVPMIPGEARAFSPESFSPNNDGVFAIPVEKQAVTPESPTIILCRRIKFH